MTNAPGRCEGKVRFTSMQRARKTALQVARRHDGRRMAAYRCRSCGFFHVGTNNGKVLRDRTIVRNEDET